MIESFQELFSFIDMFSVLGEGILINDVDKGWELFNIPLVDMPDFLKLFFKFSFFLFFLTLLVRFVYYPNSQKKSYLTTYILIGVSVFMISITLENVKLELGFALGLFAIFGIIRYRTNAIEIKEMTYLFAVIGLAVMNALANKKVSWLELVFANLVVLLIAYGLEHIWLVKNEVYRLVVYERIKLIKPDNHNKLIEDLSKRTGLKINRISIGDIDFLKDTAKIKVFYFEDEQKGFYNPDFEGEILDESPVNPESN